MKIIKQGDGLLDVINKIIMTLSVFFGVWAYFHTIHPVFQKELELQRLRNDKEELINQKTRLKKQLIEVSQERKNIQHKIYSLQKDKNALQVKIQLLNDKISKREQILKHLKQKVDRASDSAVLYKLEYYSNKMLTEYFSYIHSFQKSKNFDPINIAKGIILDEKKKANNKFEEQAIAYFERYIQRHSKYKFISSDDIVDFITSLPFDYKIEKLKETLKSTKYK